MTSPASVWFGPTDRPLFGRVHLPGSGSARAGVVLCPSLGTDGFHAFTALQDLAEALAGLGFAVLRFDYDGTGDSAGDQRDPARVETWQRSIHEAIAYVRSLGVDRVSLVGMRAGATMAAMAAAEDGDIDAFVMWDPSLDARTNIREQRALFRVVTDEPDEVRSRREDEDGGIEMLGFVFDRETMRALDAVDLLKIDGGLARHVLVATRSDRVTDPRLIERMGMAHVDWAEIDERLALLGLGDARHEAPDRAAATGEIGRWLSKVTPVEVTPVSLPPHEDAAVVAHDQLGRPVIERTVDLGPVGLFGITTEVEGAVRGPTVILLNSGLNYHIGPGRMWVELARSWAGAGLRTVRADLSGIGESPVRPGQEPHLVYTPEALDDISDIADAVASSDPSDVILVGICAGAYTAIEGAIRLGARGMCAVNPILTFAPPERDTGRADPGRQAVRPKRWWMRTPIARSGIAQRLKSHIPPTFWAMADLIGLQPSPAGGFEALVGRGVDTFVLCDQRDSRPYLERAPWALERLEASGHFRFQVFRGFDHLLYTKLSRQQVRSILEQFVVDRWVPSSGDIDATAAQVGRPGRAVDAGVLRHSRSVTPGQGDARK